MRDEILQMVQGIKPLDGLEAEQREEVLSWVKSGADLFRIQKPATPPKHLVSYFTVIDPDERKILLVDHIKAQKWLPTGGHVDIDEHPRATVMREAQEELSIMATFLTEGPIFVSETVTVGLTAGHTDVSLWFAIRGKPGDEIAHDPSEFKAIRWFAYEEVMKMDTQDLDSHMHRFMRKWMMRATG